jgi:hypothetical protein
MEHGVITSGLVYAQLAATIFLSGELALIDEAYRISLPISSRPRLPPCGTEGFSIKLSIVGMECVGKRTDLMRNIYVNIVAVLCIHEVALMDIWKKPEIPKQALCMYGLQ